MLDVLKFSARDFIFTADTRAALTTTAQQLEAGSISAKQADQAWSEATTALHRAFESGDAFADTVALETQVARRHYLYSEVAKLIATLRADGRDAAVAALEGAKAAGDFQTLGKTYLATSGADIKARLTESIEALLARYRPATPSR